MLRDFEREDVGRLLDPLFLEEELDLLFAEAFDIEGAARGEQLEMFNLLIGTGELTGAAGAGALLAGGGFLTHHFGMEVARAFLRKMIGFGVPGALVQHHVHHLRNDVAGALDDDGVTNTNIAALA